MAHDPTMKRRIVLARTMLVSLEALLRDLITDPDSKTDWIEIQCYQGLYDAINELILGKQARSIDSVLAEYARYAYDDNHMGRTTEARKQVAHYLDILASLHNPMKAG